MSLNIMKLLFYSLILVSFLITPVNADTNFTGVYSDDKFDYDLDGSVDFLKIEIEVNFTENGTYIIMSQLQDQNNVMIDYVEIYNYFSAGIHQIQLNFSGKMIYSRKYNGSFNLKELYLLEDKNSGYFLHDFKELAYTTNSYNYTDFQMPDVIVQEIISDKGLDSTGDELFDKLQIISSVESINSGYYRFEVNLFDSSMNSIETLDEIYYLSQGTNQIDFNFSGTNIGKMSSGTYLINTIFVFNNSYLINKQTISYETAYYSIDQFGFTSQEFITSQFNDYGNDTNDDGYYEYLTVNIKTYLNQTGDYKLIGHLSDANGQYVGSDTTNKHLGTGIQNVTLNFEAARIQQATADGQFTLSLELYDANDDLVLWSESDYKTSSYYYNNFSLVIIGEDNSIAPSSSSGGGGGSGSSGEAFENIAVKDVVRMYLAKDISVTYEFKEDANAIGFVSFDAKTNAGYITATVEVLNNLSTIVSSAPSDEVYQNMNIWIGLAGFATDNNIANPVIGFKVLKSWINENDIDESTIKLNRYSSDAWNQLPTTKTNEDDNYIYFSSETSGFSPFSISGYQKSSAVIANVQDSSDTMSSVAKDDIKASGIEPVDVPNNEDKSSSGLTALVSLVGISILSVGIFLKKEEIGKWINQRRS